MMLPIGNKAQVPVFRCGLRRRLRSVGKGGGTRRHGSREPVLAYLRAQIDELRAREPGVRSDSPDAVHGMRVASRRLRSSLATFRGLFEGPQAQHLREELLWLGAALGPVRDVEVMREHLHGTADILQAHTLADTLPGDTDLADALDGLDHELTQRCSRALHELTQALDSPRYFALLAALSAFEGNPPWAPKVDRRHTLAALAGRACARVDRAALAAKKAPDPGGPELHEVRKAAKRARYAAEVAVPSVGAPARSLARRMEDLQEVLGRHQDSLMVRDLLRDLARRAPAGQAYTFGLLTGLEGAGDEQVMADYRSALAAASTHKVRDWTP
jgi:CHAD domain-containing protein